MGGLWLVWTMSGSLRFCRSEVKFSASSLEKETKGMLVLLPR